MAIELEEFHQEFFQEVHANADAEGKYVEDAFFDFFCRNLVDAGELDSADRAYYVASRGIRIDGYGGDPGDTGILSLIISDFQQSQEITTLTATEMKAIFKRASNFLENSLYPSFVEGLEETSPGFGLADLIAQRWKSIRKVRFFLISNRVLSSRVDGLKAGEFEGRSLVYSVWDLVRLHRFVSSSYGREEIEIDLVKDFGKPISALPAHLNGAGYEAYLVVIPGQQLAAIYDRWGARLLEQNVRVFLQARGNVNKGIRDTIEKDPEMFFAYNNGITATAESVQIRESDGRILLTHLKNFQIVNGGQTTASIHAASRKKDVDLSRVFVQMKLSVIEPERTVDVVPKISECANSQNRVNAADFFANHPFHIRMEEFSRRIYAPSSDGSFRQSKWFYERARGQYIDARGKLSKTARDKFDSEYPKRQVFTKTDLAKYLYVWWGHPDIVSKGAQKNFVDFARRISMVWSKTPDLFNERFYRDTIAKVIVFRSVENLVMKQNWYGGGYRANIVAYAIAKLAADVQEIKHAVDFCRIWKDQCISKPLEEALAIAAFSANHVLENPLAGMRNVTEWAKQQACWNRLKNLKLTWPENFLKDLLTEEQSWELQNEAIKDQKDLNRLQAQITVCNAGGNFWNSALEWGTGRNLLSGTEVDLLIIASQIPEKVPTEKQSIFLLRIFQKIQKEGCTLHLT